MCQYALDGAGAVVNSLGSYTASDPTWSLIKIGSTQEDYTKGVMYKYTNGDLCYIGGTEMQRTVLNVFRCAQQPSDVILVSEEEGTCVFTVTYQSVQACPTVGPVPSTGSGSPSSKSGLSGGWVFIIMCVTFVFLPFV
jgi:hypothetical protein